MYTIIRCNTTFFIENKAYDSLINYQLRYLIIKLVKIKLQLTSSFDFITRNL